MTDINIDTKQLSSPFSGLRGVGYARVSTRDQHLEDQTDKLQRFFESQGLVPVGSPAIYQEKISGASAKRKERDKILDLVKQGKIDIIIATKLDRWGRSVKDLSSTFQLLKDTGVKIYFVDQNLMLDDTPTGNLTFNLFSMIAQFERDLILERTKDGRYYAQLHGTRSGNPMHRPLKDLPDKMILTQYKAGASIKSIAKELKVSPTTVRKRLINLNVPIRSWKIASYSGS